MKTKSESVKKSGEKASKTEFRFLAPEAISVFLSGDFNQWSTSSHPLRKGRGGEWTIAVNLGPGTYQYRFIVDGEWQNDPSSPECAANPFGTLNCVRTVA